ncbi:DNA-directed RNA polymerase subunit alpha [Candidatus Dojkabacteria bacterium]|uniref:DNA-directed RNA polymerase subunit alpha n=1 Tax=Candidatus Dojkabacteria bacterium TaxID=2099670 RepID=A0A955L880_9BACT|nr:DNA-directed RNA polymerase subunit alpha [Candidatus Dojkabacteria bacterium]
MFDLNKFKVLTSEESQIFTKFEIGPLPKGFGHTIGNAIRRILLTSISGAAVTAVRINGVDHEYTTLKGLQEDVLTLVLNLKNVAVISHSEEPVTLKLKIAGDSKSVIEVTAGDFEKNSDIEIANPELVLAHLTKESAKLSIEIVIENGFGYQLPDQAKRKEVGIIPIDGLFSPVKHVKLDVVETRVGQQTDLDQVNLEVTTNGASTPKDAFLEAVEIFDLVANRLVDLGGGDSLNNTLEVEEEEEEVVETKKLPIFELSLSTRLRNSLLNSGINDLMEIEGRSRNEVMSFKGMGKKSFDELITLLNDNDISIKA